MILAQQAGAAFLLVTVTRMVRMVVPADAPVLINEEPGTGKDFIAELAGFVRGQLKPV